jgi:3',5'-cyclic-AMP phosphodiesterase
VEENNQAITFVVPGDLHLTTRGRENYKAALSVIGDANELIDPDFVQFIGDNVQDASDEQFQLFRELADLLAVPHFVLVGDHDLCGDGQATKFRERIGDPVGSTELRGCRFLRLNTLEKLPLGFSERQLGWLDQELEAARVNQQRVVVFQHHYPYKVCEDFAGPGVNRWRELIAEHRPVAVISGHTHYGQVANDGRNVAIATRSIGDPEGGPPGYLVAHLQGDQFAVNYRTVQDEGPLVLVTHPRELLHATDASHVVHSQDVLKVRVWSRSPVGRVVAAYDGGESFDLQPAMEGWWEATLDGTRFSKGEHRVCVEARSNDGRRGGHDVSFFVDATRRFTAVPSVSPIVRTTAFC